MNFPLIHFTGSECSQALRKPESTVPLLFLRVSCLLYLLLNPPCFNFI